MLKIYTTPTCGFCETLKSFLKGKKIKYQEYDISRDEKAQKEIFAKSHQYGVPMAEIDGKILINATPAGLEKMLKTEQARKKRGFSLAISKKRQKGISLIKKVVSKKQKSKNG